ncbi:ribbon-helix-helix domain-containing protein [Tolypothrix sp. VBCCA 56010]|uniref:ribbon-helix-helix domain-containing protein n=1 Tax=Tolypothrix sp. VBCCA 56010 TaxID=3137731 RepID=UPI003D7E420C
MPQGQYRRPRINFGIEETSKEELEEWAKQEHRTVSNLVEATVETALAQRRQGKENIKYNSSVITEDDFDQIKKFISLLCGDRERNGISFVLLGQALGFEPEKLHDLYQLVLQCRKDKTKKK